MTEPSDPIDPIEPAQYPNYTRRFLWFLLILVVLILVLGALAWITRHNAYINPAFANLPSEQIQQTQPPPCITDYKSKFYYAGIPKSPRPLTVLTNIGYVRMGSRL